MLDIKLFREDLAGVKANLKRRGDPRLVQKADQVAAADKTYLKLLREVEQLRKERNSASIEVGKLKREKKNANAMIAKVKVINKQLAAKEQELDKTKAAVRALLFGIPNLLDSSVPTGKDENQNVQIRKWGRPKAKPLHGHEALAISKDWLDIERAAKVAGARFYYLKNDLAILDLALQRFALDMLRKKKYTPIIPPYLLRRGVYEGVVSLSDFENVMYEVDTKTVDKEEGRDAKPENDLFLIATAEHPLATMYANEVLPEALLPLRYAGVSPCFRKEAGSHGKDTKGIFRVHQFHKVEQFVFCKPEDGENCFAELLKNTEELYKALELPYRVMNMCTGDIGDIAAKKIDLEVWMPHQQAYREIASCSNCTDYQARRLNIRYGVEGVKPKGFVYTLNNTAIATSRTLVAILENFQQKDGSVKVPAKLVKYVGKRKLL
ncbi:MAG: serine--tRNA ligase [Nanoarchaeota archaeon]|nr:serine--tRNA ligase [Nanoarchaeota archaeon]